MNRIIKDTKTIALALLAIGMAAPAFAVTYNLTAKAYTINLPDGQSITMWGYCKTPATGTCTPTTLAPTLTVPAGQTNLTVNLTNNLPEATSIVIPGLQTTFAPVYFTDPAGRQRARSFVQEAAATTGTATYTWKVNPGTYVYHSGSHPGIQVQMGLYGAVTADFAAANGSTLAMAYPGVGYAAEQILVYSEIDKCLHDAVAPVTGTPTYGLADMVAGTGPSAPSSCGPNQLPLQLPNQTFLPAPLSPTSPMYYAPTYYMVNGASYASLVSGATRTVAGTISLPAVPVLLRFLNAGNKTHVPELVNGGYMSLVAEDGNKYPYPQSQYSVFLPAGKTMDVLWTPPAAAPAGTTYALFDKSGNNNTAAAAPTGETPGGMIVELAFVATNPLPVATANSYTTASGTTLTTTAATGVMANDTNVTGGSAAVVTPPSHAAAFTFNADGSFSYTPATGYSGADTFTYNDVVGGNTSNTATVTITITPLAPVAANDTASTTQSTPVSIPVLSNDLGTNLVITNLTQPAGGAGFGSVALDPTQSQVVYTAPIVPDPSFGASTMIAQISDASLTSIVVSGTTATVNCAAACNVAPGITVTVAGAPAASGLNGSYTVQTATANAFTMTVASVPAGTYSTAPLAVVTPLSPATATFTYAARDTLTNLVSNSAVVTATVTNIAPVAVNDSLTTPNTAAAQINVLANDYAPGSTLDPTSVKVTAPTNGTATVNPMTGLVTYTVTTPNFIGSDSFSYTVNNTLPTPLSSNAATVTVHVTASTGLVANPDSVTINGTAPVLIPVLNNDVNSAGVTGAGAGLTVSTVVPPAAGQGTVTTDGTTLTYTPPSGGFATGTLVTFQYQARDAATSKLSNLATVTVAVGPVLTSITPGTAARGATVPVTLTGLNLTGATAVTVSGGGVTVGALTVTATTISTTFTIAGGTTAALGARTVTVTTAGGTSNAATFTVAGPTLTSITPGAGARGTTVPVTLTGVNLTGASAVTVSGPGVNVGALTVTSTTITTTFTIVSGTAAALGARTVTVTTPLGTTTDGVTFTVLGPTLTSISPNPGYRGTTFTATLKGSNLSGATGVTFTPAGGVTVVSGSVHVVDSSTVTANLQITAGASLTTVRNVAVVTPNGTTTDTVPYTVTAPTLTSISPTGGWQGTSVPVILTGVNLTGATAVNVSGSGVTCAIGTPAPTNTTVNATCAITAAAATSNRNVTVATSDGPTNAVNFLVNKPPLPTLSTINPTSGTHLLTGSTTVPVTLTGTNFTATGTTVAVTGTGITVGPITVVNSTTITTTFTIANTAATTSRNVTVTNPGGTSNGVPFKVN